MTRNQVSKERKMCKDTGDIKNIEDIKRLLKKHRDELFQRYRIKELGIFGSYVRDEQNRRSDIEAIRDQKVPIEIYNNP